MTVDELKDIIHRDLGAIAEKTKRALQQGPTTIGSNRPEVSPGEVKALRAAVRAIADGLEDLARKLPYNA